MRRINSDPDGREPDWSRLEGLVGDALAAFANAERPDSQQLNAQLDSVEIASLDFTGHGFYANLYVHDAAVALPAQGDFPAVRGWAEAGEEKVSLLLWIGEQGRIVCLEGYNAGDVPFTASEVYNVGVD